jgi:hypothetical protein
MGWPLNTDTIAFLRALATVRDNPFLWVSLRRDLRRHRPAVALAAWIGALAVVTACALALGRSPEQFPMVRALHFPPGRFAVAVLLTMEYFLLRGVVRGRRFDLGEAARSQAVDQHRLIPLPPVTYAGMQNTYPLAVGMVLTLCALPLHALALAGGGGRIGEVVFGHLVLLAGCVAPVERWARPRRRVPLAVQGVTSGDWAQVGAAGLVVLAGAHIAIDLAMPALQSLATRDPSLLLAGPARILLLPHTIASVALHPAEFWGLRLPPWAPLMLWWMPSVALRARLYGRWDDRTRATARIYPWSVGGVCTAFALTVLCGYLWPCARPGALAPLLGGAGPDSSRAFEAMLGLTLAAWVALVAGPDLDYDRRMWWGLSRPPARPPEPDAPAPGRRREITWALEAAGTIYVPCLALLPVLLVGGISASGLAAVGPALGVGASVLLARSCLGRARQVVGDGVTGKWAIAAWLLMGFLISAVGVFAPAPFGRWFLAVTPLGAATSLVPGIGAVLGSGAPHPFFQDPPSPAQAAGLQVALACVALAVVLHPRSTRAPQEAPRQAQPALPTVQLFRRDAYLRWITTNPVAVRILRSRKHAPRVWPAFLLTAGLSLAAWFVWGTCLLCVALGANPESVIGMGARYPWPLVLVGAMLTWLIGMVQPAATVGCELSAERATGAYTLTCLTPLGTSSLFRGYVAGSLLRGLAIVVGSLPSVPLLFVGTYQGVVWVILGVAVASMVYISALAHSFALLYALPRPETVGLSAPRERRRWWGVGLVPAFALVGAIALAWVGSSAGATLWYAVGALALAIPAYAYRLAWLRFRWMRENAIPDRPEVQEGGEGQTPLLA